MPSPHVFEHGSDAFHLPHLQSTRNVEYDSSTECIKVVFCITWLTDDFKVPPSIVPSGVVGIVFLHLEVPGCRIIVWAITVVISAGKTPAVLVPENIDPNMNIKLSKGV